MNIKYCELNVEGKTLRGFYSTPDKNQKQLCVMYHGFTGHKNENGFLFKQISEALCNIGIATLRYDYMGSGDSDGDFSEQSFDTVLRDARAILASAYEINNHKPVIVLGFSMGGATAARMSVEFGNLIEKLVLMSPAATMYDTACGPFKRGEIVDDKYVDLGGYYISKDFSETLRDKNLYEGCETFTKPVLITQGSEDLAVFPKTSKKYTEHYKDYRYALVMGAPHCYTKVKYRKEVISLIIDFLK